MPETRSLRREMKIQPDEHSYGLDIYSVYPDLRAPRNKPKQELLNTLTTLLLSVAENIAFSADLTALESRTLLSWALLNRKTCNVSATGTPTVLDIVCY